jgi:hypothetical protein
MRDVYEVLREKEQLLERLQGEVSALQLVAPLLEDEAENVLPAERPAARGGETIRAGSTTSSLLDPTAEFVDKFRARACAATATDTGSRSIFHRGV